MQGVYKKEGAAAEDVVVQVLKEEATMDEEVGFREISIFAIVGGGHPNVLTLVGQSYDAIPRLQAFELCRLGDLKSFMADNRGQSVGQRGGGGHWHEGASRYYVRIGGGRGVMEKRT